MKNKKNIFIFITLLILLILSITSLALIEVTIKKGSFFDRFKQGFFIVSGTVQDTVVRGEKISAKLTIRWTETPMICPDGKTNQFKIYFESEGVKTPIFIFTTNTVNKVGDFYNVNFNNLDTSIIPKEWCNRGVFVSGEHYYCIDNYFVKDTVGGIQRTNPFTLKCEGENLCEVKKTGNRRCDELGRIEEETQIERRDSSGNCVTTWNVYKSCSPYNCKNAICVETKQYEDGYSECLTNNFMKVYKENSNSWDYIQCENGCSEGKCQTKTTICTLDENVVCADGITRNQKCINGVLENIENICIKICKDVVLTCSDGKQLNIKCVDGKLDETKKCIVIPTTPTTPTTPITDQTIDGVCNKYQEWKINRCVFSFDNTWENYKIHISIFAMMLILLITFVATRSKNKK